MRLYAYSFNGHLINDGTNYKTFMPLENPEQGDVDVVMVNRSGRRPAYAAKVLKDTSITLELQLLGANANTQMDTIKTWFDVEDDVPHKLICKDRDNSNKQWFIYATTKRMVDFRFSLVTIILSVADPVWQSETENLDAWTITASGQTNAVVVGGNVPAHPRFVITPTAAAGSRYAYRRLALWRNPNTVAMLNEPLNIINTVWDTAALVAQAGVHVTINDVDGTTPGDTTITYDGEVGDFPDAGMAYVGTDQIIYTGKTATELTGVTWGNNGTTAAVHADNEVIYSSKIQANGNDIRVFVDGQETNRWLQDVNTANTKVWIAIDFQPGISLTLDTAIADSGAVPTITFKATKANDAALKKLPPSGMLWIENEGYFYTALNIKDRRATGCTRAIKGTVAAAHATGTTIYWIEHEIFVYYGNQTADAPETDDTRKPIIDLTSTNTSWVYTSFWDITGLRAGSWKPALVTTANTKDFDNKSDFYTGNQLADADPATEMGAVIKAWKSGSIWKAENAKIEWSLFNPSTFIEITAAGEKYRSGTNWPAAVKFMRSANGSTWTTVWTEATPATAATWTALSAHSAVSLSTGCKYLKMSFSGALGATANNYAAHELEAVTLTRATALVPQGSFNAEEGCYFISATITNNTTGEWLKVTTSMLLNTALTIDCENKKAYTADNHPVSKLEFSSNRKDWLNLLAGTNTLKFDDPGSTGLSAPVHWRDRNS